MLKCTRCYWVWKYTHKNECPQCGCRATEHVTNNHSLEQWREKRRAELEVRMAKEVTNKPCCYRATHTRGVYHDEGCPNYVICY